MKRTSRAWLASGALHLISAGGFWIYAPVFERTPSLRIVAGDSVSLQWLVESAPPAEPDSPDPVELDAAPPEPLEPLEPLPAPPSPPTDSVPTPAAEPLRRPTAPAESAEYRVEPAEPAPDPPASPSLVPPPRSARPANSDPPPTSSPPPPLTIARASARRRPPLPTAVHVDSPPAPSASNLGLRVAEPPTPVAGNLPPAYPPTALRDGVQGRAVVRARVLQSGRVGSATLEESSGDERLDRAALEAVRRWSFLPATRDGKAVDLELLVPVNFRIRTDRNMTRG